MEIVKVLPYDFVELDSLEAATKYNRVRHY